MGTLPNMARSLVVIVALMALLFMLVPRITAISTGAVDATATARGVVAQNGWPLEVATDLPDGWTVESARHVRTDNGAMAWFVAYRTPAGNHVSLEQMKEGSADWIKAEVNRSIEVDSRTIDGRDWIAYERQSGTQNSLVHEAIAEGELTTLVTGSGSFDELTTLVEHLTVVEP